MGTVAPLSGEKQTANHRRLCATLGVLYDASAACPLELRTFALVMAGQLDATAFHRQTRPQPRWGVMASFRSKVAISSIWQVACFGAAFSAPDFSARLFAYEPQLRGRGAFPAFYGRGFAGVLLLQCKPSRHWIGECPLCP